MDCRRGYRVAQLLAVAGCAMAAAFYWMPAPVADLTIELLARFGGAPTAAPAPKDGAVVVLSGRPSRVAKAVTVVAETGLPLYIAGGELVPLFTRAGIRPTWVESVSTDTRTNALVAACTLLPLGIKSIALVTDEYHMARATLWFRVHGLQVTRIPSPVPSSEASRSAERNIARHEVGGIAELALAVVTRSVQPARCTSAAKRWRDKQASASE